jgi:hypothetical protein
MLSGQSYKWLPDPAGFLESSNLRLTHIQSALGHAGRA